MHSLWTHYLLVAIVPWAGLGVDKDLQSPFRGFPSVSLFPAPLHGPSAILLRTTTPTPSNLGMQFATPGTMVKSCILSSECGIRATQGCLLWGTGLSSVTEGGASVKEQLMSTFLCLLITVWPGHLF